LSVKPFCRVPEGPPADAFEPALAFRRKGAQGRRREGDAPCRTSAPKSACPRAALAEDIGFFLPGWGCGSNASTRRTIRACRRGGGPRAAHPAGGRHGAEPGEVRILADDPVLIAGGETALVAPGGTRIGIEPLDPPVIQPPTEHAFVVRRLADGAPWVVGRAGMEYRDLVPGSPRRRDDREPHPHSDGGPVPDMVHFHKVGFQLIFCIAAGSTWSTRIRAARRLYPGDCFVQPPEIRHRVLHASDGIEVIEIGVPAEHATIIDHDMELPTAAERPQREFSGQRFVHNKADGATWTPARLPGFENRDTTVAENTGNVAAVTVLRRGDGATAWTSHDADILFGFMMRGTMTLDGEGVGSRLLEPGDAFVVPPGMKSRYAAPSLDAEILEVALPGRFKTSLL
jgi:quercetin dioxygenase-like cupin family protein